LESTGLDAHVPKQIANVFIA